MRLAVGLSNYCFVRDDFCFECCLNVAAAVARSVVVVVAVAAVVAADDVVFSEIVV